jgi:hypothetical protein
VAEPPKNTPFMFWGGLLMRNYTCLTIDFSGDCD